MTKVYLSPPRNIAQTTFGKSLIMFSTNVNLLFLLYLMVLHLKRQSFVAEIFSMNFILDDSVVSNMKLHNKFVMVKKVKKVITDLLHSKIPGPDGSIPSVPLVVLEKYES